MLSRLREILLAIILLGVPCLLAYTYTGPYRWLAEAQLAMFGRYYEIATFMVSLAAWALFCAFLAGVVSARSGGHISFRTAISSNESVVRHLPSFIVTALLAELTIAGYYEYRYRHTIYPTNVSINDVTKRWRLPGSYLAIDDAVIDTALTAGESEGEPGATSSTYYMPMLPPGYQPRQEVQAFVEVNQALLNGQRPDPRTLRRGLVTVTRLPGMIRVEFERNKILPASRYVLIEYGSTPDELRDKATLLLSLAGVTLLGGVAIWFSVRKTLRAEKNGA